MRVAFRIAIAYCAVFGIVWVPALATGLESVESWPRPVVKAFKKITSRECFEHIKTLASDAYEGRECGTEGGRLASTYVERQFLSMGLEPGGRNGSFFQPFTLSGKRAREGKLEDSNRLEYFKAHEAKVIAFDYGKDFLPLAISGEGHAHGTIEFLAEPGAEVTNDEPARAPIGLLLTAPTVEVANRLADHGTKALFIVAADKAELDLSHWPGDEPVEKEPPATEPTTKAASHAKIPIVELTATTANKLLRRVGGTLSSLRKSPLDRKVFDRGVTSIDTSRRGYLYQCGRNIIGIVRGHDPKLRDEAIVIGAHYDHLGRPTNPRFTRGKLGEIHNGADDNASGTSGLIELAEAFAQSDVEFKRSVVFIAFDGEEEGLLGSSYYALDPPVFAIAQTRAMLNMDMISRNDPRAMKIGRMDEFGGLNGIVDDVARRVKITLDPEGMDQYIKRSDQWPFIRAGVPAVFFFGGMHSEYHTERDDVELVNPYKASDIARLMFLCALQCANYDGEFK